MRALLIAVSLSTATCVQAATIIVTPANFDAAMKKVRGGDTVKMVGTFTTQLDIAGRTFSPPITIDATGAVVTESLSLVDVSGLRMIGGTWGNPTRSTVQLRAIRVHGGSGLHFTGQNYVAARLPVGTGIHIEASRDVSVVDSVCTGTTVCVGFSQVTDGVVSGNRSLASTSDGFDIAGSVRIRVEGNYCSGTVIYPGAHPDCVQLWSLKGIQVSTDITIVGNTALGDMQGFSSFDPSYGGGVRIKFINNSVNTSYPEGIVCYGCFDSEITGNSVTTIKGSPYQTTIGFRPMNDNRISGNDVGPRRR